MAEHSHITRRAALKAVPAFAVAGAPALASETSDPRTIVGLIERLAGTAVPVPGMQDRWVSVRRDVFAELLAFAGKDA